MDSDQRTVSLSVLVAAMRAENVPEPSMRRVLENAFGLGELEAAKHAAVGRTLPEISAVMNLDTMQLAEMLQGAHALKDWPAVVAYSFRLAELEADPHTRARIYHAAALIQRDELVDLDSAADSLDLALDADATLPRVFEALVAIHTQREDWKSLERAYRRMIVRTLHGADETPMFDLWTGLGHIYRDRLGDRYAAREALKMAAQLRPEDPETLAALADLE